MTELSRKGSEATTWFLTPIVAASPHAIIAVDRERRVRLWNPAAAEIFGWTEEEVLGRPVPFVADDQLGNSDTLNERALRGEAIRNFEVQRLRRDGVSIELLVSAAPTRDNSGQIDGFVTVATDITEFKNLQSQFLRTQRLESLGTLASGIAHDLNNVLAPVQMALELFRIRSNDPATARMVDTLDGCVKRGAGLVRQILTFARGAKGGRTMLETGHILRDIENILRQTMPRSITVETDVPRDLWPLSADVTQLHQVLMNLCVNARDAMPGGGVLSITVRNTMLDDGFIRMSNGLSTGPHICLEVKDSGDGMSADVQSKIFDPFFTTKDAGKGTGLGLSTVASIVKAHGGSVHVYSEPGRGTSFKVYWPAQPEEIGEVPAERLDIAAPAGHGEVILIVDDEAAVRDIATLALEAHGYKVLQAEDGADGVAVYAQHRKEIQLVISDMDMPIMNGAAMIKSIERINPDVRILSASGLALEKSGPTLYNPNRRVLSKPYTAGELLENVRSLIGEA